MPYQFDFVEVSYIRLCFTFPATSAFLNKILFRLDNFQNTETPVPISVDNFVAVVMTRFVRSIKLKIFKLFLVGFNGVTKTKSKSKKRNENKKIPLSICEIKGSLKITF